ncbi:MAG: antibiotic biosynthesis monooxygenase family protein [Bacteroidota bacterium]
MKEPITEVAVYTVKDELMERFLQQQSTVHGVIKQFKGFRSLRSLRSLESPNTFVDYCEWDSHDDAVAANSQAMTLPEMKIFFELGDGMISFGHYATSTFSTKE